MLVENSSKNLTIIDRAKLALNRFQNGIVVPCEEYMDELLVRLGPEFRNFQQELRNTFKPENQLALLHVINNLRSGALQLDGSRMSCDVKTQGDSLTLSISHGTPQHDKQVESLRMTFSESAQGSKLTQL